MSQRSRLSQSFIYLFILFYFILFYFLSNCNMHWLYCVCIANKGKKDQRVYFIVDCCSLYYLNEMGKGPTEDGRSRWTGEKRMTTCTEFVHQWIIHKAYFVIWLNWLISKHEWNEDSLSVTRIDNNAMKFAEQ